MSSRKSTRRMGNCSDGLVRIGFTRPDRSHSTISIDEHVLGLFEKALMREVGGQVGSESIEAFARRMLSAYASRHFDSPERKCLGLSRMLQREVVSYIAGERSAFDEFLGVGFE